MVSRYSPGQWHLRVPKERKRNLRFRLFVLRRCRENPKYRESVLKMCKEDILFWIDTFVWQYNPNAIGPASTMVGPWISFDYQRECVLKLLDCIANRDDCIIEKSREMGISWLCLLIMVWFWLFHPMSKFLCVSRNAEAVDDREDSDSLFWKIDYVLEKLPEWMIDKNDYSRKVMSFRNKRNGSMITGQATTGKAGVGGRCLAMFVDEFSQIDTAREIYDRTSDTTSCRIFNGTHKGIGSMFHELTQKANTVPNLKKIVMHWSQHPDKVRGAYRWNRFSQRVEIVDKEYQFPPTYQFVTNGKPAGGPEPGLRSPWYDEQCTRKGSDRAVAADLDINPTGTSESVFPAMLIKDLIVRYAREPFHRLDLAWHRNEAEPVRFYPNPNGKILLWQRLSDSGIPEPGYYVFGADIATGVGATPSCLSGANAETGEKILEFADANIEPKDFTYLCIAICRLFKTHEGTCPKLVWEIPGPGNTFTKHAMLLQYENPWLRIPEGTFKKDISHSPGWTNNPQSAKTLIEDYKDGLRSCDFLNRSKLALEETLAFHFDRDGNVYHSGYKDPKNNSDARANHGDRVIADALCWKLVQESKRLTQLDPVTMERVPEPVKQIGSLAWRREFDRMRRRHGDDYVEPG